MKVITTLVYVFFVSFLSSAQPNIEWQKSFGGSDNDISSSIRQTTDGGYIIGGSSWSNDGDVTGNHGNFDFWVVKATSFGDIEWQKALGGTGRDVLFSVQQTFDGGYVVGGSSRSNDGDVSGNHGEDDFWVVKLDSAGGISWQKPLGGSGDEELKKIEQTADGGFIVVGWSISKDGDVSGNHGLIDFWVVKLTNLGVIEWQKTLGGSHFDLGADIQETSDGGYIVTGSSRSNDGDVTGNHGMYDVWVVKLTNTGIIEWQRSYGGSQIEYSSSIDQTSDGGYIVGGYSLSENGDVTNNQGGFDFWAVKLSSMGILEWQRSYGGSQRDSAYFIEQTIDGGFIMGGISGSSNGDITGHIGGDDYWLLKLSLTGNLEWEKSYGGSDYDKGSFGHQTTDGGYIFIGDSESDDGDVSGNHGERDYWVIKLSGKLGVNDNELINNVMLYPNPNTGRFSFDIAEEIDVTSIIIIDAFGRTIYSETNTPSERIEIDQNFTAGVYFVNVSSTSLNTTLKMIVE